jgi:hypothetical protein
MMIWQFAQVAVAYRASGFRHRGYNDQGCVAFDRDNGKVLVISFLAARAPAELLAPLKSEQLQTSERAKRADIISAR